MEQEELTKIADTIVCCPYCREMFRVSAGWYFADNPSAERDSSKMLSTYISKQLSKSDEGIETGSQ